MATASCTGQSASRSPSGSAATTTTRTGGTTIAPSLTADQLRAHLGAGAPSGWAPVDEGKARVFVPGTWILESKGACIGGMNAGVISVGGMLGLSCDQLTPMKLPDQAIAIYPSSATYTSRPSATIHGYRVYAVTTPAPEWKYVDVPQLGVRIATHGNLGPRVLRTLAPSARTVALDPGYGVVPHNWHNIDKDGVSLSIPASWSVVSAHLLCGGPIGKSQLVLIGPKIVYAPCPYQFQHATDATYDAVDLYLTPQNRNAPQPSGRPIANVQHGTTTVTVYAERDSNSLDLLVRRAGSPITHVLTVGLGRDGRTAAAVIASIRATT
jgi:hypothetical protein